MPGSAESSARRRRTLVTTLQITASTCAYGAAQLGNGLAPGEAARTARFLADELAEAVVVLRGLDRPVSTAQRRQAARQLASLGLPTRRIAAELGVTDRSVRYYLHGRTYARPRVPVPARAAGKCGPIGPGPG